MTRMNLKLLIPSLAIFVTSFTAYTAPAAAQSSATSMTTSHEVEARSAQITFKTGKIIEIAFASLEGGKEAQLSQNYFPKIMPLAAKYGGKMLGSFSVNAIIQGEIQPQMISLFEWPSLEARDRLLDNKEAQKLFPIRDDALTFFKQAFYTTEKDVSISFREDRIYEFFNAWLTPDAKEFLPKYFEESDLVKTKYGPPKFVATLQPYTHSPKEDSVLNPHMFGIVEWKSTMTYYGLAADPEFKKVLPLLDKALTRIDMLHARFNFPE